MNFTKMVFSEVSLIEGKPSSLPDVNLMGPPGFEPESMAPEATRMPSYPTGPFENEMSN